MHDLKTVAREHRRVIRQVCHAESGENAKEKIHDSNEGSCREPRYSSERQPKLGDQPPSIGHTPSSDALDKFVEFLVGKAVEEEVRHDQVVFPG